MRVLGVIIAGGKSSRMGQDKALMVWKDKPLIAHVAERLGPQVDVLVINANKNELSLKAALSLGTRGSEDIIVIPDLLDIGTPLAGLQAALAHAVENGFDAVLSAPCDAPLLPENLRLRLQGQGPAIAISAGQAHYLTGFWPVALLGLFDEGQLRRVMDFAALAKVRTVEWPGHPIDPFANINTPEDFASLSEKP
jgi:molybdopterin-guanine dinucleotide biosynthesis protein A